MFIYNASVAGGDHGGLRRGKVMRLAGRAVQGSESESDSSDGPQRGRSPWTFIKDK